MAPELEGGTSQENGSPAAEEMLLDESVKIGERDDGEEAASVAAPGDRPIAVEPSAPYAAGDTAP